jgi:hypothetical protein
LASDAQSAYGTIRHRADIKACVGTLASPRGSQRKSANLTRGGLLSHSSLRSRAPDWCARAARAGTAH